MTQVLRPSCCVCDQRDERTLVEVALDGGAHATLCGSHAVMFERSKMPAQSAAELRARLGERRQRSERRRDGDELGAALAAAFSSGRREGDRRGA